MTDSSSLPHGRAILRTVRASLRLVNGSSVLLTVSQLRAMESDLRKTLAVVKARAQARQPDGEKVVLDLSDWESGISDDEVEIAEGAAKEKGPLSVPGPYPMNPPETGELPEFWYVVSHGTKVGIFADGVLPRDVVESLPEGDQVKVSTWHEATTMYNLLLSKGLIVRVRKVRKVIPPR